MRQTNIRQFYQQFPTDDACLEHLFTVCFDQGHECPKCEREARWYRLRNVQAFSCEWCGHHLHPMVGTIFEKSRTPLQLWFYAIFLFTTTRHGVSAKELQRQLGVTYKTAWRMAGLIREHMAAVDGDAPIGGKGEIVQVDETFVGGVRKGIRGRGALGKTIVLGMMEPDGEVVAMVIPNLKRDTIIPEIVKHVEPGTQIHTDEMHSYKSLPSKGFEHRKVHHARDEYVGKDGTTVNAIENFWRHLMFHQRHTHISVSGKHLQRYVKEFEYRFNRRTRPEVMLSELLSRFPELRS